MSKQMIITSLEIEKQITVKWDIVFVKLDIVYALF